MKVAIIKYNAGNVRSVIFALERLGVQPLLTDDPEEIRKADKVIFPGQGEAKTAMRYLGEKGLDLLIPSLKQPFLGICLGLQLMCRHSEEGDTPCLGLFDIAVKRFEPKLKVPHMGWNLLEERKGPLFDHLDEQAYMYFVHSYYAGTGPDTTAKTNYVNDFSAAIHKDNFYALQGHPEKSGKTGEQILKNFLAL